MKKIEIEAMNYKTKEIARAQYMVAEAEAHKARCKTEKSIIKAEKDIVYAKSLIERYENELAELEAAKTEALERMAAGNAEAVFAWSYNDEYGCSVGAITRTAFTTYAEAEAAYTAKKKANGGWITGWIEIRKAGETAEIEAIAAEIAQLEKKLNELTWGDN